MRHGLVGPREQEPRLECSPAHPLGEGVGEVQAKRFWHHHWVLYGKKMWPMHYDLTRLQCKFVTKTKSYLLENENKT